MAHQLANTLGHVQSMTHAVGGFCREFEFSLISGPGLEAMAVTQRMQVNAGIATVQLGYGGKLVVETTNLTAQAFKVLSGSCLVDAFQSAPMFSIIANVQ